MTRTVVTAPPRGPDPHVLLGAAHPGRPAHPGCVARTIDALVARLTPGGPPPAGRAERHRAGAAGTARVVLLVLGWGTGIGAVTGGVVGAYFVIIGALFGAPIGAAVGLAVAAPAAPIVVVVCRSSEGEVACRRRLAEVFAGLVLLIGAVPVAMAAAALVGTSDTEPALAGVPAALVVLCLSVPPMALLVGMLRSANRSISAAWYRRQPC